MESHQPSKSGDKLDRTLPAATTTTITNNTALTPGAVLRKKGSIGVRAWLLLDSTGRKQVVEAGKYALMRRTGLFARDLRVLDPILSYPCMILGRDRAIVINLEHIKAIITAHEVLLLNAAADPLVTPFVEELQRRLQYHYHATKAQDENRDQVVEGDVNGIQGLRNQHGSRVLPFEFVTLEACLEAACACLENEATTLEQEANPALDRLTTSISTLNLDRVRQIKSRLVTITKRVQKVRDELENLLDDDEDMAEMYLTDKLRQKLENSLASSMIEMDDTDDEVPGEEDIDETNSTEISFEADWITNRRESEIQKSKNIQENLFSSAPKLVARRSRSSTTHSTIRKSLNVQELEMLLEAYFVQIDATLNKLFTLKEYVDDTQDYINIMLDDKQNKLLQMGVLLTTAAVVLNCYIVLAGVMGINIKIHLFKLDKAIGYPKFLWTNGACSIGTVLLYVLAVAYYKHKRWLDS